MYNRHISPFFLEAMKDTPVVFLAGARQTGKSTLVKKLIKELPETPYLTMDDSTIHAAAFNDPDGFISGLPERVVIDEVQKVPELLAAIKASVDTNRRPGRFLLTGSANVLTIPRISESLAGRVEFLTLWPLSQGEITDTLETFIDMVFSSDLPHLSKKTLGFEAILEIVTRGGYPEVIQRPSSRRQQAWYRSYITALMQRDLRDLAHIEALHQIPNILHLLATRCAGLLNLNDISRLLQIPHTTLKRYITMLEALYLVIKCNGWSGSYGKRLVKMPKVYVNDTGLICHLLGVNKDNLRNNGNLAGQLLENFVANELMKQIGWSDTVPGIYHFRTHSGIESDIILENRQGKCVCIEVKLSSSVSPKAFKNFHAIKAEMKSRFHRGIVLYTGEKIVSFDTDMYAIPVDALWG